MISQDPMKPVPPVTQTLPFCSSISMRLSNLFFLLSMTMGITFIHEFIHMLSLVVLTFYNKNMWRLSNISLPI